MGATRTVTPAGTQNAADRERWLSVALSRIPSGARILDAGAGERQFQRFCRHLDYVSQDFGRYDGSGDMSGLQTGSWDNNGLDIISDITSIPEPDLSFDAIMCVEVLEHLPHPIAALREFSRLIRPGGTLVLTAPFCSLSHFTPFHYYTGFTRYFYVEHLAAYGFVVDSIEANGNYFEYLAQELRRLPEVAVRYGTPQGRLRRILERYASRVILGSLTRQSLGDRGSSELLSYGLHVIAKKAP